MNNTNVESKGIMFKIKPNTIPATAIQRPELFPICSGGFNDIWKCFMSTQSENRPVAIKAVRVPQHADREPQVVRTFGQRISHEAYVWIQLSHESILPFEGVTEGFGPLPALVTPWMENGSLNDYLRREVNLSREKKLTMVREVAAGLRYLHDKDIVHGDLTGTNILVSGDGTLHIGDFSLSTILAESDHNSYHVGNVRWMAPEVITMDDIKPTKACDIYSYGCIMMQVFSGRQPYHNIRNSIAVMGAKMRGIEPFSQLTGVDEDIQEVSQRCWLREIRQRPLVADIADFFWLRTDIKETTKKFLSNLAVNIIPQTVLTKCSHYADDFSHPSSTLECKWLQESGITEVAVKTMSDNVDSQSDLDKIHSRIRREIYVMERLRRETILPLYGITTGFGVLPSFVYPWMAGGSLHDYLKRDNSNLNARRKLDILVQVADGIKYLHKQDIAHGNLTGDVIFLDASGRVRIAEFSHSVILAEANSRIFSEQL
ncbi:kinase-like domain-containing protein, partial [Suillus fuscotomentosus]